MQPWRGNFVVSGLRPSDRESSTEVTVSAVEIDGDWCVKQYLFERTAE